LNFLIGIVSECAGVKKTYSKSNSSTIRMTITSAPVAV